jgi:hypothetical protein
MLLERPTGNVPRYRGGQCLSLKFSAVEGTIRRRLSSYVFVRKPTH